MNKIQTLNKILNVAIISDTLKEAIKETIKALENNDTDLAYQITACKSLISGTMKSPDTKAPIFNDGAFKEDGDYNIEHLNHSVYSLLDDIHHELAFSIRKLPSGMMGISNQGISSMKHTGDHPIIQRIKFEIEEIQKSVRANFPIKNKE